MKNDGPNQKMVLLTEDTGTPRTDKTMWIEIEQAKIVRELERGESL